MDEPKTQTYPGGIAALLTQMEGRRDPMDYAPGEGLPPPDLDLAPLATQTVPDPDADPAECGPFRSSYHRKRHALRKELAGRSELVFLNALLIAHLRRRRWPDHAPALFQRLWAEQGAALLDQLDPRWAVSAVTTFGDHGLTPAQRSVGLALSVLFSTMKLYESERLYSGQPPDQPFALEHRQRGRLPLDMDPYALAHGGLDVNMIGRLWLEAEEDPVIAPLAHHLLERLIAEPRGLLHRLARMRADLSRRKEIPPPAEGEAKPAATPRNDAPVPLAQRQLEPDQLRWGLVALIRAPLPAIARFAAHHLDLGAQALHLYLDDPDPDTMAFLSGHARLHVTACDAAFWRDSGRPRPEEHQLRQVHVASRALRAAGGLHWLGHIDVDEFLLPARPMADLLAEVPPDCAVARIAPAEALAPSDGWPRHFKITHRQAGLPKSRLQEVYPTFGAHLYGGFLSHTAGKIFARTGIPDTRLGIHTLKYNGAEATNRHRLPAIWLAHLHAPSWQQFRDHLEFRRTKGSYRRASSRPEMGQAELLRYLMEEEGEAGLRALFDEVCADTPELRRRLAAQGMLVHAEFDPDAAVARIFGALP